ncbi:paraquat-inducible protein A [bacterium SCSIO 12696]|nr:paraquat-inducible protein A [bacterium SCSIO 12696]
MPSSVFTPGQWRPEELASAGEYSLLRLILLLASALFIAGLWMPIATIEQFFIFDNQISVLSGLWELATGGQLVLFVLILLFSVLLPLAKMGLLWSILLVPQQSTSPRSKRLLHIMHDFGRWSMLDVFVVAMLVVGVKLTAVADMETHLGLYLFCSGILLTMGVTARVAYWHRH